MLSGLLVKTGRTIEAQDPLANDDIADFDIFLETATDTDLNNGPRSQLAIDVGELGGDGPEVP